MLFLSSSLNQNGAFFLLRTCSQSNLNFILSNLPNFLISVFKPSS